MLLVCIGARILRGSMSIIYKNYSTALIKQGYSISLGLDYLGGALQDSSLYYFSYTI